MPELLTTDEIAEANVSLPQWTVDGATLVRAVQADSFAGGIRLVDEVAVVADEMNHHPDVDIRWTTITFHLSTHSKGGLTQNDVELAHEIDAITEKPH
ncbi:MAG: 4a-hydroxytetrahydrobiopterin dehydratase [Nocardioidaceae bacterium]